MPFTCSLVGFALEGGASSDIIENINVSKVNDHIIYQFPTQWKSCIRPENLQVLFLISSILQAIIVAEVSALNLITDPFTDFSKDVDGHDAHKGDSEDPGGERGVGADDSDAGHPEAGVALGEKGLGSDREVGYSESHRVRPLHLSNFM